MRSESKQLEKEMHNRHLCVTNFTENGTTGKNGNAKTDSSVTRIEGYLFKRTSKGFKSWNRRWFYLSDNKLMYK